MARHLKQWRRWLSARTLGAALVVAALAIVAPYLASGTEMVRLRNALALGPDLLASEDWTPPTVPPGYLRETVPPDPYFVAVAQRLRLDALPDDWARTLAISAHLLGSAPNLNGGASQDTLRRTYQRIVEQGDGYCGDFIRVFTAIASAAGMVTRTWAFSFDGFGGHGHIVAEVWSRQEKRWMLADVFNNQFFVDADGRVQSALEVRRALASGTNTLRVSPLETKARLGFVIESKGWAYYRRGLDEWYMPWGNDVFTYDSAWPARIFGGVSRIAEGLGANLAGVVPSVRMLASSSNAERRAAMHALRLRLVAALAMGVFGLALIVLSPWLLRRAGPRVIDSDVADKAG